MGLLITFAHRSFQEYFVAKFISSSKPKIQQRLIRKYAENVVSDSVLTLLYEMNPELVEAALIIPGIEEIEKTIKLKNKVGISHYQRFLSYIIQSFQYLQTVNQLLIHFKRVSWINVIYFTFQVCHQLIDLDSIPIYNIDDKKYMTRFKNSTVIPLRDLNARDELIADLATKGGIISMTSLQHLIEIKNLLLKKHEKLEDSLDEILATSKVQ